MQAGSWSRDGHYCYPPAFKAVAAELLRISRKHGGGAAGPGGRLKWPFAPDMMAEHLLPLLASRPTLEWL